MISSPDLLFTPYKLSGITLRNRVIRAAAFEGMCPGNMPSDQLLEYHRAVAAGGVGMTTVAYASVDRSGLSFPHQLWLREEAVTGLRALTGAVHREGAACSIQLGHCGNMAKRSVTGSRPVAPSARFNLYGPSFPRALNTIDIREIAHDFARAVHLARESGFDAVEVHAGHGYLISQFLSPYTNRRRDGFGGSLQNRARFMHLVMDEVKKVAGSNMPVLVKMNMSDGFRGGMEQDECLEVASMLEQAGADALVLSGGFVSRAPMYVMRGHMPVKVMAHYMDDRLLSLFVRLFGNLLVKDRPFEEAYFLKDALKFRARVKLPLVYLGGLVSRLKIDEVLAGGFELVAMARSLITDPGFVNRLRSREVSRSACDASNYCIARMYSRDAVCIQNIDAGPEILSLMPRK